MIANGAAADQQACSGFEGTDLEKRLRGSGLRRLYVGGPATDDGVLNTVKDARSRGFTVFLLRDAIRAMNLHPDDGHNAEAEMIRLGAMPIELRNLAAHSGADASQGAPRTDSAGDL